MEHCFRSDRTNGILLQPNNWKLRHRWTVYLFVVATPHANDRWHRRGGETLGEYRQKYGIIFSNSFFDICPVVKGGLGNYDEIMLQTVATDFGRVHPI